MDQILASIILTRIFIAFPLILGCLVFFWTTMRDIREGVTYTGDYGELKIYRAEVPLEFWLMILMRILIALAGIFFGVLAWLGYGQTLVG